MVTLLTASHLYHCVALLYQQKKMPKVSPYSMLEIFFCFTLRYANPADPRTCAHDNLSADGPAVAFAKWNLAYSFTFVGDTGRFAESVWLLQHTFGWGEPMALSALSRSAHNFHMNGQRRHGYALWSMSDLRSGFVNELATAEACDVALYAHARELVASRLANMPSRDEHALKRFLRQTIAQDQAQLIPATSTGYFIPHSNPNDAVKETDGDKDSTVPSRAVLKHQKELIREKRKHQKAESSSEGVQTSKVAEMSALESENGANGVAAKRLLLNTATAPIVAVGATEANERTGFNATAWRVWLANDYNSKFTSSLQRSSSNKKSSVSRGDSVNGTLSPLELAAAHEWWLDVVQKASKASPPRANKATLVFLHVPKTVRFFNAKFCMSS